MLMQFLFVITIKQSLVCELRALFDGFTSQVDKYLGLLPTDSFNPLRRDQNLFPRPPVQRVDNQVANSPRLVVDDKILNVADLSVLCLDITTRHRQGATEMRIVVLVDTRGFRPSRRSARRVGAQPPWIRTAPVPWPAIISVIIPFILARDRPVGSERRALLDLRPGQVHRNDLADLVSRVQGIRRNENLLAG